MIKITPAYLESCPEIGGIRQRGLEMTRIEVFVDAAFAFAVTMLVISFDAIPRNWEEIIRAIKNIPAFAVAVAQLVWIWHEHSVWSRRYGLDDSPTVVLSTLLLIVMLVFIYPLRIMAGGMFSWFTGGYLPSEFKLESWDQLAGMFVFFGAGLATLFTLLMLMYAYAARRREALLLNRRELYATRTVAGFWAGCAVIALLSMVAALLLRGPWVPFAGFVYLLTGVWGGLYDRRRTRDRPP